MNTEFVVEKQRETKIVGNYDVIVCGGGVAGVAAAVASARNGAKTLLIEKQYLVGGLATAGLVTIYLPLCDGQGHQVSFGLAEELLNLSIKYGYDNCETRFPKYWYDENSTVEQKAQKRFEVQFNPYICAILYEKLMVDEGIDILYGSSVCDVVVENNRIEAVIVENKTGRNAYTANNFIDCTGDADICKLSNELTAEFNGKNILAAWYYRQKGSDVRFKPLGFSDVPNKSNKDDNGESLNGKRYSGLTAEELTEMTVDSHEILLKDFLKEGNFSSEYNLTTIATIPQVRKTRRLDGNYTMDDTEQHKHFEDSVGMFSDWRKKGPVYELPYNTLVGKNIENLLVAGRCISVTDDMWEITRVIPVCAVSGEAVGTAAAMYKNLKELDIKKLQNKLEQQGVKLHINSLEL